MQNIVEKILMRALASRALRVALAILVLPLEVRANVIGSDAQNFNPTTNGLDFVTVHSSETLDPGVLNLGLFFNYAVNTLPFFPGAGSNPQSRTNVNDHFFAGDLNLGLGLTKGWDIGISFPYLIDQSVDNINLVGFYDQKGFTETRANTKLRLSGDADGGVALIGSFNINRIGNNPYVGEGGGAIVNVELAADTTINRWALGANIGYRIRNSGTKIPNIAIEPMPDQFIASAAASYLLSSIDTKVIFELYSGFPVESNLKTATDREYTSYEALFGIKHDFTSALALHSGVATGLGDGVGSPDWRVYAGLNWTFGPLWGRQSEAEAQDTSENYAVEPYEAHEDEMPEPLGAGIAPMKSEKIVEGVLVSQRSGYDQITLKNLQFMFGSAVLTPASRNYMRTKVIEALRVLNKEKRIKRVFIGGHTDSVGSTKVNLDLSQFRANAIKTFLDKNLGLPLKVVAKGFGESRPIANNGNYQGRAKNRRVEMKLYY